MVVNRDPKTGLNYLSIKGNEAQGVSVIITSDKDIETLNKLADEFQKYPVSSQRSTAEFPRKCFLPSKSKNTHSCILFHLLE